MKSLKILLLVLTFAFTNIVVAQSVYTTKTGEKYHKSSCKYLKYSKKEYTLKKALELGFSACSICKPGKGKSTSNSLSNNKQTSTVKSTSAIQCIGKTKAGKRCKRKTKNTNQRCYQH